MTNSNHPDWDTKILGGSIKRNIVNPDIQEEREKCNFDKAELVEFVISKQIIDEINEINEEVRKDPNLQTDINFFKYTREE